MVKPLDMVKKANEVLLDGGTMSYAAFYSLGEMKNYQSGAACLSALPGVCFPSGSASFVVSKLLSARFTKANVEQEAVDLFLEYLVKESHFKDVFHKDWSVKQIKKHKAFVVHTDSTPAEVFSGALVLTRALWEGMNYGSKILKPFQDFVKLGAPKHHALMLAHHCRINEDGTVYFYPLMPGHSLWTYPEKLKTWLGYVSGTLDNPTAGTFKDRRRYLGNSRAWKLGNGEAGSESLFKEQKNIPLGQLLETLDKMIEEAK